MMEALNTDDLTYLTSHIADLEEILETGNDLQSWLVGKHLQVITHRSEV